MGHHLVGEIGRLLEIVLRADDETVEDELFGGVAAEQHAELGLELGLGGQVPVLGRCSAASAPSAMPRGKMVTRRSGSAWGVKCATTA